TGPRGGAGLGAARAAARRADTRPGLPGQGRARRRAGAAGRRRAGGAGGDPRRGVRGAGLRRGRGAGRGRGGLGRLDPRGAGGLAVVRPAGHQDPGCGLAAGGGGPAMSRAVPLSRRSALVLGVASVAGMLMLVWPLLVRAPEGGQVGPPFVFLALLPVVIVVVLAEVTEGGL